MKYTADTSFIIGLFVNEPRTAPAKECYNRLKAQKEKIYVPSQTIIETIYVLEKFYKLDRTTVSEYIQAILGTFQFIIDKYEFFYNVMDSYTRNPSVNLGDIIIAEESKKEKISDILSFDKHFEKLGFNVINR
jgi:predicted nucleic-acid-binding protein